VTAGPARGPELDYPEKRVVDLRRMNTGEISLDDLVHEAKSRAARRPKEIAAIGTAIAVIIGALAGGTVKIIGALREHDDRDSLQTYRQQQTEGDVKTLQDKVDKARLKLERCRCPKEDQ
jgi:hypothetical protein